LRQISSRNAFITVLKQHHIGTSVQFIPRHLHPSYRDTFGYRPEDVPHASAVFDGIVSLPSDPQMTGADVQEVIGTIRKGIKQHRR
jgi:dTDP-4-amino-4,6-dideoxygalactose transaminase